LAEHQNDSLAQAKTETDFTSCWFANTDICSCSSWKHGCIGFTRCLSCTTIVRYTASMAYLHIVTPWLW